MHRLQACCRAMRAPGGVPDMPARSPLWRTRTGRGHRAPRHFAVAQGKQLMEAAERGTHKDIRLCAPQPLSLLPSRCAPGAFQSSPTDPDTSTLPGTFFPEPGALHWRWPSVSIRSSSCHPVVTSTTPYRHRPSVRRVRPCVLYLLRPPPRAPDPHICGTVEIRGIKGTYGAGCIPDPGGIVQSGFLNIT